MSKIEGSLQLIAPKQHFSEADLENCCWLFLARELDARAVAPHTSGAPLHSLVASFLASDEFKAKLRLADGKLVMSEAMLLEVSPDLLDWVVAISGPGGIPDAGPVDRLTAVRKFLTHDPTRMALNAIDPCHILDIDALNGALAQMDDGVRTVAASPLFDAIEYRRQLFAGTRVVDAAAHYVLFGEALGITPSLSFDPAMYVELNPDLRASEVNRLLHYETWGRQEKRKYRDWVAELAMPPVIGPADRPTVLLLLHDATYTGAPILGWNLARTLSDRVNVVVVPRRDGELDEALRDVASVVIAAPPDDATLDALQMRRFAERLAAVYRPLYAIANSVESRPIAVALRPSKIPIVALVHEFWPASRPGLRLEFYASCAAIVFPAHIVEQSSFHAFREIGLQNRVILPQGPCAVPPFPRDRPAREFGAPFVDDEDASSLLETLLADGERGAGPFTVIGLGAVEMRKGVDLFISAAMAMSVKHPYMSFRFIWIGTWEHAIGTQYAALLEEQYTRCDLGDRLHFFSPVDDLQPVYARADALFLSSRLDPLPNVMIDAAFRGVPVVCFDRASGAAELLSADPLTQGLVVPHLDSGAAAECLGALASDPALWASRSEAVQQIARRTFDMAAYAGALDDIGRKAARTFENADKDRRLLEEADAVDASIYFGGRDRGKDAEPTPAASYIEQTKHINFSCPAVPGVILRRPIAGFHPFIYGTEASDFPRDGSRDPLAHYIERGRPEGRWTHPVLRADLTGVDSSAADDGGRRKANSGSRKSERPIALHGHFHYPENFGEFLIALAANQLKADLFLTTTSDRTADILREATEDYRDGTVLVEVGPNLGRDIFAFLRVLGTHIQGRYDLVGHLHGKRSLHTVGHDPDFGDRWRCFLWEHLLGPNYPAADVIVDAMRRDPGIGLVFPEDGSLVGWEENAHSAALLQRRFGLQKPLPSHIEFPSGTMFWARVDALSKLVAADFREEEMPAEPLPIDGTVLHALERMLPLLCEEAGYSYATSYIPGINR